MLNIRCKCNHQAPFEQFTHTATGELPKGQYQCPACGHAWRLAIDQPARMIAGFVLPATVKIVGAQAQI